MKKHKILISFVLFLFLLSGFRKTIFAQQLQLSPYFKIEHSTNPAFDFRINLWPDVDRGVHNFIDTLKVTNEFAGSKTMVTNYNVSYTWPILQYFFPVKWPTLVGPSLSVATAEEPNIGTTPFLKGKLSFSGKNNQWTKINADFEYIAANEQILTANKKVGESFTAMTTPIGDATLKFNSLNVNTTTSGIKYLILASSKHDTKTGNSVPTSNVDYDLLNVSTSFRSPLPAGWTPVSNVITFAALTKSPTSGVTSQYLTNPSDLIIKYDEYGLKKGDEMKMALFWGGAGGWTKHRCVGENGATIDTLNNTFTAPLRLYGTFMLAVMDRVHYSTPVVESNTISYRFAADTLYLSGSVDSTGMLQAFAGKEIILTDGFVARPGSVLSLKLTGDYCGAIQQPSTAVATRIAANQEEMMLSDEKKKTDVSIYPNPTNGSFTLVYTLNSPQRVRIAIKDVTGREIKLLQNGYQDESTYKQTYQTDEIGVGMYFVELITETEKVKVVKLIKQ